MKTHDLKTEIVPIDSLIPDPDNPRKHSRKQRRQIASSMRRFGITNPILVDEQSRIIAGHGRHLAAQDLGLETVPIIRLTGLTEADRKALMLADNRIAENSVWDPDLLQKVLQGLVDVRFDDIDVIGLDNGELDKVLCNTGDGSVVDDADAVEEVDRKAPPISRLGDMFRAADHRVLCGNALDAAVYETLLEGALADLIFADCPYNLPIKHHVSGLGAIKHVEFLMASGEMSEPEFITFLRTIFVHLARYSRDGSIHFVCMDWRHLWELLNAARDVFAFKNLCCWAKDNGGMGSLYRSQHELVAVFKNGTAPHVNNVELGRMGRNRTNVWHYPGVNTLRKGRLADLRAHPTVKPVALVADAILDCSNVGQLILDPFLGSGTTLLACERTQRRAAAIEIDPYYVDTAIRRFQERTGIAAVHVATGLTFDTLARARAENSGTVP